MPAFPSNKQPDPKKPVLPGSLAKALCSQQGTSQSTALAKSPAASVPPREKGRVPVSGEDTDWVSGYVNVITVRTETRRVNAQILGPLSVHQALDSDKEIEKGCWSVTVVTTGQLVTIVREESDALRIAKVLHDQFAQQFRQRTPEDIKRELPAWVKSWVTSCRIQGKFIPPAPFMRSK